MADITKTIEVIFGAVDRDLDSTLNKLGSGLDRVTAPAAQLTESLLKTETAIAAASVALVAFSVNAAGKFNTSISEIGALFNATSEQSLQLGEDIKTFASDSTSSIDEINTATFTAISTGTEWTNVTKTLVEAEKLAIAGSSDLATTTAALSRTMNAYGKEAGTAKNVSEALFIAAQQGDTNLTKLASAFGNLAPTSKAANISLDDSLAALAAITVTSGNTEKSVTQLNALFRELASPSKELTAALGGVSLETDGLQAVMQKLQQATGGTQAGMDALFGSSEAVAAAVILANDASGKFNSSLDAMTDKAGKVTAAYERMKDDFTNINKKLANNVRLVLIEIGDDLQDEYAGLAGSLTKIFKDIGISLDQGTLKSLTDAVESFAQDLDGTLDGIATAFPAALDRIDFTGLLQAFSRLFGEFESAFDSVFGEGLDLSKPEDLAKALQGAINLISTFVDLTAGIVTQLEPIFEALGEITRRVSDADSETANSTGRVLAALASIEKIGLVFFGALEIIRVFEADITRVFDVIVGTGKVATNTLQVLFDTLLLAVVGSLDKVVGLLNNLSFGQIDGLDEFSKELDQLTNAVSSNLSSNFKDVSDGVKLIGGTSEEAAKSVDGLGKSLDLGSDPGKSINETTDAVRDFDKEVGDALNITELTAEEFKNLANTAEATAGAINSTGAAVNDITKNESEWVKTVKDGRTTYERRIGTLKDTEKTVAKTAKEIEKLAEQELIAIQHANEMEKTLAELASNEKIKSLEFSASIQVASIEADAQRVVAAFESISTQVVSTNDLIGSLTDSLKGASGFDRLGIQDTIDDANDRAERLADQQEKLNDAEVERIKAKTQQLKNGGSEITVIADNLAPELEALLESLINNIRIKAVAEGATFITG